MVCVREEKRCLYYICNCLSMYGLFLEGYGGTDYIGLPDRKGTWGWV